MKENSIPYTIGKEVKQLTISFTSQGTHQIMMDEYYQRQAVFSQNKWNVYLHDKSELNNSDDIQALIQILSEQKE